MGATITCDTFLNSLELCITCDAQHHLLLTWPIRSLEGGVKGDPPQAKVRSHGGRISTHNWRSSGGVPTM